MLCVKCNTGNDDDSKFCKECGERLLVPDPAAEISVPADTSLEQDLRVGELIYSAHKYRDAGSIEDAVLACHGALALSPDNLTVHSLLASLYEEKGDIDSAVYECERILALQPDSLADREKLQSLRSSSGRTRFALPQLPDWAERFKPYIPQTSAALVLIIVLCVGFHVVGNAHGSNDSKAEAMPPASTSPVVQIAPPVNPYAEQSAQSPAQAQGQPPLDEAKAAEQSADQQAAQSSVQPAAAPAPAQPSQPRRAGAPPVPVPGASVPQIAVRPIRTASRLPALPDPNRSSQNQPPVIVPVDDSPNDSSSSYPRSSGPAETPVIRSVEQSPVQVHAVDPETRAVQLQGQGKYQDAINSYRSALSQGRNGGHIYQQMALCYQRLGQRDLAISSYKKAISYYRSQASTGRDAAEAERSIKTCQLGIQVLNN